MTRDPRAVERKKYGLRKVRKEIIAALGRAAADAAIQMRIRHRNSPAPWSILGRRGALIILRAVSV